MAIDTAPSSTGVLLSSDNEGSPIPTVYFDMITLDERGINKDLIINLKMHIEIPLEAAEDDILENLSVCVVRCTDASISRRIQSVESSIKKADVYKIYEGPLKNLLAGNGVNTIGKEEVFETTSGAKFINMSFQKNDGIKTSKPLPHLSYYAFCYLDLESLVESLGIQDIPSLGPTIGPISGESVISASKVNTTSYVYFITSPFPENLSGTYWTGPVLQDKNGKWRTASWHPSRPRLVSTPTPMDLERIEVRNTKIQDFRILKQIPSLNYDLIPGKFSPITIRGRDTLDNSIQNPDAYISNAFLTRDMHNNCRFIFEFDYDRALVRESKFGKILTNPFVPSETKRKIYQYSSITNLKIIRKQVETVRGYNRLSSVKLGINNSQLYPEKRIIVQTASDKEKNNILKKVKSYSPGTGKGNEEQLVGSIMEIKSLNNSPKHTRTIAVTDWSSSQLQNGTYQYGVQIEMEDGSVRFLNERLKRLRTLRTYLKGYYDLKQVPKKSYQTISNIRDYYNIIFSSSPEFRKRGNGARNNFNRVSFADKIEINNLRTELGFLIGRLDPRETLYPWVIVPEYLVDTLEAISDFSYITKSGDIDTTQVIQTPSAILNPPDDSPPEILGRTTGLTRPNEVDSGARDYGIGANQGASLDSFDRIDSDPSAPTAAQLQAIDLFDEKTARFSLRTLLDPRSATSESILQVIGIVDMVTQKIRTMMGSSAQIEEINLSTRQKGVSKNSKVSVLNLEDYFIELFDARLSSFPALDYIGFKNSIGIVSPTKDGNFEIEVEGDADVDGLDESAGGDGSAGPNGMPYAEYQNKLEDEDGIDDLIDQEELDRLAQEAEQAAAEANAAEAAAAEAEEGEEDAAAERAAKAKAKAEAKARAAAAQESHEGDRTAASGSKKDKAKRKLKNSSREQRNKFKKKFKATTQENDAPPNAVRRDEPSDTLVVTPTVFDNRAGQTIIVSGHAKLPPPEVFTNFQNSVVAQGAGSVTDGPNQDNINSVMSIAGVEVLETNTPMAVQDSLTTGQATENPTVAVRDILGADDRQSGGSRDSQNNTCVPGSDGGDGATDLARCKNQTDARSLTQTLMNMFAENGSLSRIFERADGNVSLIKDMFKEERRQNQQDVSTYGSSRERLIYGMMARITIFMGYEKDSQGNFMIKRPIFKSPRSWDEVMRKLKNKNNSDDVLLCRIESDSDIPKGMQMVETNTYFLITKDQNTLLNQLDDFNTKKSQTSKRDRLEKIAQERDIPPEALKSLYMAKKGGI
jgi:hypothetical protein